MRMRIGHGYDIHRTKAGDSVTLGGIQIPAPYSLEGHSDADLLLHALTDAILGALGEPDIGFFFPPSDSVNKNRNSADFLIFAREKMKAADYQIENADLTLICERPKIAPHRTKITSNIAQILDCNADQVNLKGRTNEKLGDIGNEQAMAAFAVILLKQK